LEDIAPPSLVLVEELQQGLSILILDGHPLSNGLHHQLCAVSQRLLAGCQQSGLACSNVAAEGREKEREGRGQESKREGESAAVWGCEAAAGQVLCLRQLK
jgi:hypothetical protein